MSNLSIKGALFGHFGVRHFRKGKLIYEELAPIWWREDPRRYFGVVDVGIHKALDDLFNSGTQSANWFVGLINNSGFTALANADTMSSHSGWTELTAYDEFGTNPGREPYTTVSAASRQVTNTASQATYTFNATNGVKGAFIVDDDGDPTPTVGTLFATATFTSVRSVEDDDVLNLTVVVSG